MSYNFWQSQTSLNFVELLLFYLRENPIGKIA